MMNVTQYMLAMRRLATAKATGNRLEMCEAFWDLDEVANGGDTDALRSKARKEMEALGGFAFVADYRCHLFAFITTQIAEAERDGLPLHQHLKALEMLTDVYEPGNPILTGVAAMAAATLRRYAA